MSFFNKVFASIGIGSATVDTKMEKDTYMPGETVKGVVEIKGGKVEQKVDEIYLTLNSTYLKESDDKKYTVTAVIERIKLITPFTIGVNQRKEIPFSFQLPYDTPLSIGRTKVWVSTGLDIKGGVDPSDKDFLKIVPNPLMAAVFNAVENLGFRIREADCEEAPRRFRGRLPFVQEFEFVPFSGPFRGRLDELEVVFFPSGNGSLDIMLQVDRRARGLAGLFSEALGTDETYVRFNVSNADIPSIQKQIENIIERYS
ncbi:sporulation protein [Bacillus thermocopriae]|uniref:Sporulation protein n=1 Tax=Neobacillus thermocopriae TaxID=1215031 RepID=A0A6B3TPM7_9BACI|nr:sporulation protein [Neobacillus thermocopriae]MED3625462.1 sporulation protein [Neobacillus thermocopriae]MED3714621.1 sporulation protein [Neobacillus thermocopriae]NEX78934.1 sporulation protein [Neobacillus thermocopriae]